VQHAHRRGALEQGGEQVSASLERVVQRQALAGEQQRTVEVVLRERLGAEALRRRRRRLGARVAALVQRDRTGDHGEGQKRGDTREHHAQAALGAPADASALVEERALGRVEIGIVVGGPVERRGQARAAVQPAGVASIGRPGLCGSADPAMQAPPLHVLVQPAAQPRPLAQERLVRDLDRAV
jgi:hypothetical protein